MPALWPVHIPKLLVLVCAHQILLRCSSRWRKNNVLLLPKDLHAKCLLSSLLLLVHPLLSSQHGCSAITDSQVPPVESITRSALIASGLSFGVPSSSLSGLSASFRALLDRGNVLLFNGGTVGLALGYLVDVSAKICCHCFVPQQHFQKILVPPRPTSRWLLPTSSLPFPMQLLSSFPERPDTAVFPTSTR